MSAENCDGQGQVSGSSAFVAHSDMVFSIDEDFNSQASSASQNREDSDTTSYEYSTPIVEKTSSNSMFSVRRCFRNRGFSKEATHIIMSSWRTGTKKQYQTYISRWLQFCSRQKIDSLSASVKDVIHFLTAQFEAGLGYSSLNTARGALSSLGLKLEQFSAGSHPLVVRFMKGVYNLRPMRSRYSQTWSVDLVLNYLKKLSPVRKLSLKELSLKLVMLIALTNAARVQTIHLLSVNSLSKESSAYVFHLKQVLKQSRPGFDNSVVRLKAYPPDRRLCVYTVLKEYLARTKDIREKSEGKLFLSYIRPYKAITRDTISRWVKLVMTRAGIDTSVYSSHSVRGASVSKAKQTVPVSEILKKAGWTRESTFTKYYDKEIKETYSFEEAVLSQGH